MDKIKSKFLKSPLPAESGAELIKDFLSEARDPQPETEVERAKRLMLQAAEMIDGEWGPHDTFAGELEECAEKILLEDWFSQAVTLLSRESGKPERFVKRVLKSKLGLKR